LEEGFVVADCVGDFAFVGHLLVHGRDDSAGEGGPGFGRREAGGQDYGIVLVVSGFRENAIVEGVHVAEGWVGKECIAPGKGTGVDAL